MCIYGGDSEDTALGASVMPSYRVSQPCNYILASPFKLKWLLILDSGLLYTISVSSSGKIERLNETLYSEYPGQFMACNRCSIIRIHCHKNKTEHGGWSLVFGSDTTYHRDDGLMPPFLCFSGKTAKRYMPCLCP